jgi:O-methyltransferase
MKNRIRKVINFLGVDIYRTKRITLAGLIYEPIKPPATFAPWAMDQPFLDVYHKVSKHTYVDIYRLYELWKLVEQTAKLPQGALIEIGVWRGGSGAVIAKMAQRMSIADPIYLCDTFVGVVKAGREDETFYRGGEHADTSPEIVQALLRSLDLDHVTILKGIFPDKSSSQIPSTHFRFCHIDVDTYQSAQDIVEWIWGKLLVGGIIVFDDYGFKYCEGVTKYVETQRNLPGRFLIHNLNGHAIIVKTDE